MDTLEISGIRAYGYTGALPEENALGQWYEVDVTLWIDLALAGQTDQLADTYDYAQIIQAAQRLIETEKFSLIERLAAAIADKALGSDCRIEQVRVRATKLSPPVPHFSGQVAVEIVRQRAAMLG
ncbi:dihydroneopterin aldolase [Romeria aff. gracilis LEGE 07310]|uniref:7,8-dihydroneopterin aldolase n=1 Tax=Vasconcelosia minhoensis LEGE 07310 TaxID=915328 RepID=A0A8J7AFS1_9CYAN|nr:dihydroneopterin aldolase [Romeria gracilis]MBE9076693.1 dihydroneopterin aldolase [Romeria aff. gracilis LEGE 07310]